LKARYFLALPQDFPAKDKKPGTGLFRPLMAQFEKTQWPNLIDGGFVARHNLAHEPSTATDLPELWGVSHSGVTTWR
jgi:hypothetical protein